MYSINKKSGNVLPSFLKQLSGLGLLDLSEYRLIRIYWYTGKG